MSAPLITIGITCYNEGDWLLECWASVLGQSDERWTAVLVMDKTSHARTLEIFEQLSHPKLRKFAFTKRVGHSLVKDKAFELTHTPYHFWLDADDRIPPYTVETVLETFERFPDADYVYGDYLHFGTRSGIKRLPDTFAPDDLVNGRHPPGGKAYKKALWERVGGLPDEEILRKGLADLDFAIGAAEVGAQGKHCGKVLYHQRIKKSGQLSSSYGHIYYRKCEAIVHRHPLFFSHAQRRRRFLGRAYQASASHYFYHRRDYQEALRLASKAAEYGETRVLARLKNSWRYRVPTWLIPLGDMVFDCLKKMGFFKVDTKKRAV